jgi:hypothetical protein
MEKSLKNKLTDPKTRANALLSLFEQLNPKGPTPLPEMLGAVLPDKNKIKLISLYNPKIEENLKSHNIATQPGSTHSTFTLPPDTSIESLIKALTGIIEALLTPETTHWLEKVPLKSFPEPSQPIPLHQIAKNLEASALELHPNWIYKKGRVSTIEYNPKTKTTEFKAIAELPSQCHTRLSAFPIFLKRGANRLAYLIDSKTLITQQTAYAGTPKGKEIAAKSLAEATRLGVLGIPTWIYQPA